MKWKTGRANPRESERVGQRVANPDLASIRRFDEQNETPVTTLNTVKIVDSLQIDANRVWQSATQ
jgi:hypothetical protein